MRPLAQFSASKRRKVRWLLTDIDDTVTEAGRLPAASLAAMERAADCGIKVIPVTGRPAGWCDHIARMWPVDAVVGENGAFWFSYDHDARTMRAGFAKSGEERARDRTLLDQLCAKILDEVPGSAVASDQNYRIADLAIDFCEDVARLSDSSVQRIVQLFEEGGATAKISSIHVNGWFGTYDKLTMTRQCFEHLYRCTLTDVAESIVFAGDSPNDQPMFDAFDNSVGVSNVSDFALTSPPKWITRGRSASGFQELVSALVDCRT